jgi:hypothetical protein
MLQEFSECWWMQPNRILTDIDPMAVLAVETSCSWKRTVSRKEPVPHRIISTRIA